MMKEQNILASCLGLILCLVIGLPLMTIFHGFVLTQLWGWFVVPLGVQTISIAHAAGLSVLVSLFFAGLTMTMAKINENTKPKTEEDDTGVFFLHSFMLSIFISLLAWGLGALYHCFM